MDEFITLTDENFQLFAMKSYNNPYCLDMEEFLSDLNHIKYTKRLLKKYVKTGILKERLILNHLIIFYNVFEMEQANKMMFFKLGPELYSVLKTFLVFLNYIDVNFNCGINGKTLYNSDIPIDLNIANILRKV